VRFAVTEEKSRKERLPLVTVIIPTYNRHVELAELLESLSRQTFRSFEVIIVNDGGAPVEPVVGLYPELDVKLVTSEENLMHVRARNLALGLARGEWIMPCDDDDLLVPTHLERMVAESGDADFLYSDAEIVEFALNGAEPVRLPRSRRLFAYAYDPEGMRTFSTYVPSGSLYRKAIHDAIGLFDPDMHHYWDWDFLLRVTGRFRIKRVAAAGVLYAFAPSSGNLSDNLADMERYLGRLCAKHGLGDLPVKNFFLLLEEPGVKARRADSEIVWDGTPFRSRLAAAGLR
jgi:glycosyltransferase involved in cell wall biosynthesis